MRVDKKSGALLALDYKKAFDSINKQFLVKTFNIFGFGEYFINCVDVLTSNTLSCISHSGWLSDYFEVNSGIRQG